MGCYIPILIEENSEQEVTEEDNMFVFSLITGRRYRRRVRKRSSNNS